MAKKDELWESESGLTVTSALTALKDEALVAFEHFFISITAKSGGRITVFTGSEIATALTQSLFSPIVEQIDPLHIGEAWRSMAIGKEYGLRLMRKSKNFDTDGLEKILSSYPSHGFVIDKAEAQSLFKNVRDFTEDENALCEALGTVSTVPEHLSVVSWLSEELKEEAPQHDDAKIQSIKSAPPQHKPSGPASEAGSGDPPPDDNPALPAEASAQ
jgi:hypothetical protein